MKLVVIIVVRNLLVLSELFFDLWCGSDVRQAPGLQ
jgi:hypothetical protein